MKVMNDSEFVRFVNEMDRCWMEGRFNDLREFLAEDVVFVAPDGQGRMRCVDAAVGSYREFLSRSQVAHYSASDHIVTLRDATAVLEYRWEMKWSSEGVKHEDSGREILVLARRDDKWRVLWRTQLPATNE
ncbi:MAG: nuclear transport factor 2 family protein [Acidobacteriaceae bacterium]|nr:nuclear transport factor 2 family protein [Acidobacteriaceae bacterium]